MAGRKEVTHSGRHLVAIEGVISTREVAATETNRDTSQIQTQPALTGQFRLTVEHVVARGTEHAHLEVWNRTCTPRGMEQDMHT